jgi:trehalose 6-phosphate synthase/phosphatase
MFEEAPEWAYSIKVGFTKTKAKYQIKDPDQVRNLLHKLI